MASELTSSSTAKDQKVTTTALDVRKSDAVNDWIKKTVDDHGKLDGAVNLAGVVASSTLLADTSDQTFDFVMGVNCTGV